MKFLSRLQQKSTSKQICSNVKIAAYLKSDGRNRRVVLRVTTMSEGRSLFEEERDALIGQIAVNMESVLSNLNALNRSLEGVVAVGQEFESVSHLWDGFYSELNKPGSEESTIDIEPPQ